LQYDDLLMEASYFFPDAHSRNEKQTSCAKYGTKYWAVEPGKKISWGYSTIFKDYKTFYGKVATIIANSKLKFRMTYFRQRRKDTSPTAGVFLNAERYTLLWA